MLYLVQHGAAMAEDEDPQRPLTDGGVDDVTRVARLAVERLGVRPSRIVHSGKLRARQTAEIWSRLTGVAAEEGDGLAPNDDPATWARRIGADTGDVLLAGHLPHLARLASTLVAGDPDRQPIRFHQGGLVALDRMATGWGVHLLLPSAVA